MIPAEWRNFAAFVRAPALPDRATGVSQPALKAVAALFLLDLILMIGLIGMAMAVHQAGFEIPDNALGGMELTAMLVGAVVILAPVMEELGFRGWLSGRPAQLLPLAILIAAILLVGSVAIPQLAVKAAIVGAAIVAALVFAFKLRGRAPFGWFRRHFAWFYFLSSLAFAAVHLTNYQNANLMFVLLVIPQGLAGMIFGYARVRYGLWANILLHMLHNATFISLALLQVGAG